MSAPSPVNRMRRLALKTCGLFSGLLVARSAQSEHAEMRFPDEATHRIVYQCNQADVDYLQHVLFSVGELVRKYGDDVQIVVSAFGPGLHLLARHPQRPVPHVLQQKADSLSQYGVSFHACANTMKSLAWTDKDLLPFAVVVPIGADDIMLLQEQGYAYISW